MEFTKPVLFLDVDGPLNPFRCLTKRSFVPPKKRSHDDAFNWELHAMHPADWEDKDLPVLLSSDMAPYFAKLKEVFTLVWATTWENDANVWISPHLGLGTLPVVYWPPAAENWREEMRFRHGSWKTRFIAEWLDTHGWYYSPAGVLERVPWVWVDDEVRADDRAYLRYHWDEPDKSSAVAARWLCDVPPTRGMTSSLFDELYRWGSDNSFVSGESP